MKHFLVVVVFHLCLFHAPISWWHTSPSSLAFAEAPKHLGIPKPKIPQLKKKWFDYSYQLASSFAFSAGNLNQLAWLSQGDFSFSVGIFGMDFEVQYGLGMQDGEIVRNDFSGSVGIVLFPKATVPIRVVNKNETVFTRHIGFRYLLGGGTGLTAQNKNHQFSINLYMLYEGAVYNKDTFEPDVKLEGNTKIIPRLTLHLSGAHMFWKKRLKLQYDLWYYVGFPEDNQRVTGNLIADFSIGAGFSVRTLVTYTYESFIVKGTAHHDLLISAGLGFGSR